MSGIANKRFDSQLSDVQFRLSGITRPIDHFIHQLLQDSKISMADALDFTRICNRSCWSGMWTNDEMNLHIDHIESQVLWKQLPLPHLQVYNQKVYCDNTTTMEYVISLENTLATSDDSNREKSGTYVYGRRPAFRWRMCQPTSTSPTLQLAKFYINWNGHRSTYFLRLKK